MDGSLVENDLLVGGIVLAILAGLILVVYWAPRVYRGGQAHWRAVQLLRGLLTAHEYQRYLNFGYLEVRSPSICYRTYRVQTNGLVVVFEHDQPVVELCVGPTIDLPIGDVMVTHKLMIEGDEEDYLNHANRRWEYSSPNSYQVEAAMFLLGS